MSLLFATRMLRAAASPAVARAAPAPAVPLPFGPNNVFVRWFSQKLSSAAKKRFRGTGRGALKRRAAGMRHNTVLKRQSTLSRKRGNTELVATPAIVRKIKRMIGAR